MAFQTGDLEATLTLRDFMTKELKKSQTSVKQFASKSRASLNRLGKAFITLGGAISVFGAARFLKSSIDAFTRQEKAVAGMEQVMKSMGRFTPELSEKMQQLARDIQAVGISGDETVIEGQKFLLTFGKITDELLPSATETMADLAALTGKDMVAAANLLGKASEGLTGELTRYGISLSDAAKESKDFKLILRDIGNQVRGQQRALRQTGFGGIEAFKNAWGDLKEEVGEVLIEALLPVIKEVTTNLQSWKIATAGNKKVMLEVFETIALAVGRVADGIIAMKIGWLEFKKAVLEVRHALETGGETGIVKTVNEGVRNLLPGVEELHEAMDAFKKDVVGLFKKDVPESVDFTLLAIDNLKEDIATAKKTISKYDDIKAFFQKLRDDAAKQDELKLLLGDFIRLNTAMEELGAKGDTVGLGPVLAQLDRVDARITQLGGDVGKFHRIYEQYRVNLARMMRAAEADTKAVNKATNDYVGTMDELKGYWEDVFGLIKESKTASDEFSLSALTAAQHWDLWYGKNDEKKAEIIEINNALQSAFEGAASIIESSFIRALDESLDKGVQWRQLAQDILGDFAKMAISMAFRFGVQAASSAIFGVAKGGILEGMGERVPVKTYARGGVMGAQTEMAIMNEGKQREAVVPLPDNRSIPVKILDGGGRGDVHIHLGGVLDGQNLMGVLDRYGDDIVALVNRKTQENPQRF